MNRLDLESRRILVVGASAGIGRATGIACCERGADVVFAARRRNQLDEAVACTDGAAGNGYAVTLDVRDEQSVESGVAAAIERLGGLDAFVYSSGMSPLGTISDLTANDWRSVLETNVVGAALVARAAVGAMSEGGIGAFLSSISVGRPRRGLVAYSASKAALDEFVQGLRTEHRDRRFLRVVVGDTITSFGESFDAEVMSALVGDWIAEAHLYAQQMEAADLGVAIAEVLGTAFAHPQIALSDVRFEPTGGPLTLPLPAPPA